MKGKIDFRIPIIVALCIILIIMFYVYFKDNKEEYIENIEIGVTDITENNISSNSDKKTIVSATSEVMSNLSENIEIHATYYLEECYVQTNQLIKKGENILKYTNGKYLVAPYDSVISEIKIPEVKQKCTNEHYIGISSVNSLKAQFKVDETKINSIKIGQEAKIKIEAYDNKELEGYVTNISSIASNGKFTVTVQFENDGEIMIGMTANIEI